MPSEEPEKGDKGKPYFRHLQPLVVLFLGIEYSDILCPPLRFASSKAALSVASTARTGVVGRALTSTPSSHVELGKRPARRHSCRKEN